MGKKNILITESQLEDLLKKFVGMITGNKSNDSGNFDLKSLFGSLFNSSMKSSTGSSGMSTDFRKMVDKIIDNFEGGYYNPQTSYSPAMGKSGETMYGIDRKWGPESNSGIAKQFWSLIDEDKKRKPKCYKLGYDPARGVGDCNNPNLSNKLKDLITQMMKPQYESLSKQFLSNESRTIVNNTPELLLNFTYCVWNGAGYFQKFSNFLNEKVKSGVKDPNELAKIMVDYRKTFSEYNSFANNLTQRGGRNMEKVLGMA